MKYVLNQKIIFNSEDCSVYISEHDEPRRLPLLAGRLLELFIDKNHQCLSREDIFEIVWVKYGLQPSGNSLNNLVSIIRRCLIDFDIHHAIVTHTKVGFSANFESIDYKQSKSPQGKENHVGWWVSINIILALLILLTLTPWVISKKNVDESDDIYATFQEIKSCSVYSKNKVKIIDTQLLSCEKNKKLIIYNYTPEDTEYKVIKKFLVVCQDKEGICISDSIMDYTK